MDQDGHDLTETQLPGSLALELTTLPQELDPDRLKDLAKIIDMGEQFH
jgi:hypothetical protein